ncbi:hypothetical protein PISMIDRAFT_686540, partial [Pisolithus microcarpus 441]
MLATYDSHSYGAWMHKKPGNVLGRMVLGSDFVTRRQGCFTNEIQDWGHERCT